MGVLSAVIQIDSAVVAPATVAVESNRKVVSHLEGGIIDEVFIHEGDTVKAGQKLFRINDVAAQANAQLLQGELAAAEALAARLTAERDRADHIDWPTELTSHSDDKRTAQLIADQSAVFESRRRSLTGQAAVLNERIAQTRIEIDGLRIARAADVAQLGFIDTELVGVRELFGKQLVQQSRLLALQRERARLDGEIGHLISEAARSERNIAETRLQIDQLERPFQEEVATSLGRARQQDAEMRAKLTVARDMQTRTLVLAPFAGSAQGLRVGGAGQVVKPGEPLVEIVPDHDQLLIHVQFQPTDIATLRPRQEVEIRLIGITTRATPLILGHIESLSGDHLFDETTHQPYFLGIVSVDPDQLPPDLKPWLRAGIPAEIVAATGERSILDYFTRPFLQSLSKTFIEK